MKPRIEEDDAGPEDPGAEEDLRNTGYQLPVAKCDGHSDEISVEIDVVELSTIGAPTRLSATGCRYLDAPSWSGERRDNYVARHIVSAATRTRPRICYPLTVRRKLGFRTRINVKAMRVRLKIVNMELRLKILLQEFHIKQEATIF